MKTKILIAGWLLLLPTIGHAQKDKDSVVRVSQTKTFYILDPYVKIFIDEMDRKEWPLQTEYDTVPYGYLDYSFPLSQTLKTHYFSFTIINDTADSSLFYIYCTPQETIDVRATRGSNADWSTIQSTVFPDGNYDRALYPVKLVAGDTVQLQMRLILSRHPINFLFIYFIPGRQANQFIDYWHGYFARQTELHLLFYGMLLMMGIYMAMKYIQVRGSEYLFYSGYVFLLSCFLWLKVIQINYSSIYFSEELLYSFAYRATQAAGYCMYFLFLQKFLTTSKSLPRLHHQLTGAFFVLSAYILFDFSLTMFGPEAIVLFQNRLWDGVRVLLMVWTFYSVIYVLFHRKMLDIPRLSIYLMGGVGSLTFFALISMLFSIHQGAEILELPSPFNQPMLYFEIGILLELLFFASGLGYKNRIDEIEKVQAQAALKHEEERLEFENYKAATEAREAERSRIAKDLHDGLGGMLSGIKFSLMGIRDHIALKESEAHRYDRALDQLGQSIQELRQVTHDMMPDVLLKYGLVSALKDYCDSLNNQTTLTISLQTVGQPFRFEPTKELILYRIVQELLANVLRHSAATTALVQLVFSSDTLSITIEDNGRGFILEKISTQGIGLTNLQERVSLLKGTLDIKTVLGKGTSVYIAVPM